MDLNTESDKRDESKKVDDDFKLKQLKAAKSECSKQLARMRVWVTLSVCCLTVLCFTRNMLTEPSIINVIFLNRTLRILFALVVFCLLLPIVDYFYFYSNEITEYQIDDSGICSHYPIYQIPCGGEVSGFYELSTLCSSVASGLQSNAGNSCYFDMKHDGEDAMKQSEVMDGVNRIRKV